MHYYGLYEISLSLRICKFARYVDHAYISKFKDGECRELLHSLRNQFLTLQFVKLEKHPSSYSRFWVFRSSTLNRVVRSKSTFTTSETVSNLCLSPGCLVPRSQSRKSMRKSGSLREKERVEQRGRAIFHPEIRPFSGFYVNLTKHFHGERGWLFTGLKYKSLHTLTTNKRGEYNLLDFFNACSLQFFCVSLSCCGTY